jgi:RNA polymerase sigma-70 factor (ECF subfamily)
MDEDTAMGPDVPGPAPHHPGHPAHLAVVDDVHRASCTELTDGDLVAAIVLHRGDAYAELFRRHSKSVTRATRMILGNSPAIEDIVAEVFVSFWMAPEKFDAARGTLLAFLRLKAKGRSIDLVRSESARRRRETRERIMATDVQVDGDEEMIERERAVLLHHAVSQLPDIEREPICLAYFAGMTYTAVADRLALPEGTVKSRIRSGLRRLSTSDEVTLELLRGDGTASGRSDRPLVPRGVPTLRPT